MSLQQVLWVQYGSEKGSRKHIFTLGLIFMIILYVKLQILSLYSLLNVVAIKCNAVLVLVFNWQLQQMIPDCIELPSCGWTQLKLSTFIKVLSFPSTLFQAALMIYSKSVISLLCGLTWRVAHYSSACSDGTKFPYLLLAAFLSPRLPRFMQLDGAHGCLGDGK